jgi:plastocyanin
MKKRFQLVIVLAMIMGMLGIALPAYASTPQTYTVLVGSDNVSNGVSISSFFPDTVKIHVGDSITWKANAHEIHTVTFLAGQKLEDLLIAAPDGMASPFQINPKAGFPTPTNGEYDGSTFMNSGILSTDPGFVTSFTLTFTHLGVFDYVCYVHGTMMSGEIDVVADSVAVPSPAQVQAQGQSQIQAAWHGVPKVLAQARAQVVPTVVNPDGTLTRTVILGYMSGNVMVMQFFPSHVTVHQGDTVVWKLSPSDDIAPHTVTFFNGAPDLPLVILGFDQGKPVLLINPAVLFPSQAVKQGTPLNSTDFFNSGMLIPGVMTSFALKIGDISGSISYSCILHDSSGMDATLFGVPPVH